MDRGGSEDEREARKAPNLLWREIQGNRLRLKSNRQPEMGWKGGRGGGECGGEGWVPQGREWVESGDLAAMDVLLLAERKSGVVRISVMQNGSSFVVLENR